MFMMTIQFLKNNENFIEWVLPVTKQLRGREEVILEFRPYFHKNLKLYYFNKSTKLSLTLALHCLRYHFQEHGSF